MMACGCRSTRVRRRTIHYIEFMFGSLSYLVQTIRVEDAATVSAPLEPLVSLLSRPHTVAVTAQGQSLMGDTTSTHRDTAANLGASLAPDSSAAVADGFGAKRWRLAAGAFAVLLAAVVGMLLWLNSRNYVSTDDAFIDAQIVHIAPQVAGVIDALAVVPNQHVEPGDLLASINPDTTTALLIQQQAGLAQGEAQTGEARAQFAGAEAALTRAEADLAAQQAQALRAQRDFDRLIAAQRRDEAVVAETQIDTARSQLQTARAQVASARGAVASARAQLESARDAIRSAEAQRRAAAARVAQAQLGVGQSRITAPLAGHVTNIAVNKGSYVSPGTQIMALVPDDLWVTANFKETQLAVIRPGQPVKITIDAYPGVTFTGKVASIQRGAGQAFQLFPPQNATGNFVKVVQRVPVRIVFDRLDLARYPVGPGMSVVPTIKVR